jgi:hypothetical protein
MKQVPAIKLETRARTLATIDVGPGIGKSG